MVEMGESRTPRPGPSAGDHYERVRWFVVILRDRHRHRPRRTSHVPFRALPRTTRRCSGAHPRCMTLPQPAGTRLLPRSPYGLGREGESVLAVASYFDSPPVLRGLTAPRLAFPGDPTLSRPRIPSEGPGCEAPRTEDHHTSSNVCSQGGW